MRHQAIRAASSLEDHSTVARRNRPVTECSGSIERGAARCGPDTRSRFAETLVGYHVCGSAAGRGRHQRVEASAARPAAGRHAKGRALRGPASSGVPVTTPSKKAPKTCRVGSDMPFPVGFAPARQRGDARATRGWQKHCEIAPSNSQWFRPGAAGSVLQTLSTGIQTFDRISGWSRSGRSQCVLFPAP